jgi:hypothetical protein
MASTISAGTTSGTAINISGDTSGALALQTNNGTTAVTITTAQNVGIGTTNPASWGGLYKGLDINTYGQFAASTGGAVWLGNNFYYDGSNYVYKNSSTVTGYLQSSGGHNWYNVASGTAGNTFSFSTPVMSIDSNGSLFIGCTADPSSSVTGSRWNPTYKQWSNSVASTVTSTQWAFNNPNGTIGSIQTTNSTTAYNTSSDYRLKENIAPMTGALEKVAQLKPCTYKWKVDGTNGEGFIAHELQEVVAGCVTGEKDAVDENGKPIYQGIDTSFLVATLTAAIQELKAEFDAYKASHP